MSEPTTCFWVWPFREEKVHIQADYWTEEEASIHFFRQAYYGQGNAWDTAACSPIPKPVAVFIRDNIAGWAECDEHKDSTPASREG